MQSCSGDVERNVESLRGSFIGFRYFWCLDVFG